MLKTKSMSLPLVQKDLVQLVKIKTVNTVMVKENENIIILILSVVVCGRVRKNFFK